MNNILQNLSSLMFLYHLNGATHSPPSSSFGALRVKSQVSAYQVTCITLYVFLQQFETHRSCRFHPFRGFSTCKSTFGKHNVWTNDGRIFCKIDDEISLITNEDDIAKIDIPADGNH